MDTKNPSDNTTIVQLENNDDIQERVAHLWNLTKHLTNVNNNDAKSMQTYFVQNCRKFREMVELPEKCFGSSSMCSFCGTIWENGNHTVRLVKVEQPSKSIRKLLKQANKNKNISKFKKTLAEKCLKNQKQKVSIKCLNCKKNTYSVMKKPKVKTGTRKSMVSVNSATSNRKSQESKTLKTPVTPKQQKPNKKPRMSFAQKAKAKFTENDTFKKLLKAKATEEKNSLKSFLREL